MWLNGSSAAAYRYALDRAQTEQDPARSTAVSCRTSPASWEAELFAGDLPGTRRIALRTTLVLGRGAPVMTMLLRLARLGAGGPQFDGWWFPHRRYRGIGTHPTAPAQPGYVRSHGRQRFSWMHEQDFVQAVRFLRDHDEISGPVNMASPHAVENRELMRTLRRAVRAPFGIPAWRFMLEPAMAVLGTESQLVLKSRWVAPKVLTDAGFVFRHPTLEARSARSSDAERPSCETVRGGSSRYPIVRTESRWMTGMGSSSCARSRTPSSISTPRRAICS